MKTCCKFFYRTVDDALNSSDFEVVEDFGGEGEGYSWSDGSKELCRCRNCGALFLNYRMKFLAMTNDSDDTRFNAYLPVASRDEALDYVDKYIGSYGAKDKYIGSLVAKDSQYKGKMIWFDGSKWCWNKKGEIIMNLDEKSARNAAMARSIIEDQNKEHDSKIAEVEKNAKLLSDAELLAIFAEYFDFALKEGFLLQQGSPRYKAYFGVVNAATREMLNNPQLYEKATKREHSALVTMCNNRIPEVTNSLICGLIFCMGKYAVVPSSMLCVDFAEAIPNCIAVYLLLTAQKLPTDSRKQVIDAGDGVNTQPLKAAMDTLSICSPTWEYHIFPADDDNKARDDAALPEGFRKGLLTSQLLARYHFLSDDESLEEFKTRMSAYGISKEKADAYMKSDIEIISRLDKKFLTDPKYIMEWAFPLDRLYLKENQKKYLIEKEFTTSEISKIFDELNWHSHNSRNRELADGVWNQICRFSARGEEPILNVAVTMLTLLGWGVDEAHRYFYNEKLLIDSVRWGYKTAQVPFAPGTDNPAIKNVKNTQQPQSLKEKAGVLQDGISEDTHPASSVTMESIKIANDHMTNDEFESRKVKAVKCTCGYFYDGNKFDQCPYCKSRPEIASSKQAQWEKHGLCKYCGGKIGGLVTKKCKSCGKKK